MKKNNSIVVKNIFKNYVLGQIGAASFLSNFLNYLGLRNKQPIIKKALQNISLEIKKGEKVAIIGKNGSGKSTLLKILSRVTTPSDGEVEICGKVMSLLEVGLGFHHELTGLENIYLNGSILGIERKSIDKKIYEIIKFSELGDFINTPIKRYSSGMVARLGFSIGIFLNSNILILDEILAVVDNNFRTKCIKKICDLKKNHVLTILFVSHNFELISQICNRGIVLDSGSMLFDGKIDRAISFYKSI